MVRLLKGAGKIVFAVFALPVMLPVFFVLGIGDRLFNPGWYKRHKAAWEPATVLNPDGLTCFQVECERALLDAATAAGLTMIDRRFEPIKAQHRTLDKFFLRWTIPKTSIHVWIYQSGAEISGPNIDLRFEDMDAPTPADLIRMVCEEAVTLGLFPSPHRP